MQPLASPSGAQGQERLKRDGYDASDVEAHPQSSELTAMAAANLRTLPTEEERDLAGRIAQQIAEVAYAWSTGRPGMT